jgi:hypothetical protein
VALPVVRKPEIGAEGLVIEAAADVEQDSASGRAQEGQNGGFLCGRGGPGSAGKYIEAPGAGVDHEIAKDLVGGIALHYRNEHAGVVGAVIAVEQCGAGGIGCEQRDHHDGWRKDRSQVHAVSHLAFEFFRFLADIAIPESRPHL